MPNDTKHNHIQHNVIQHKNRKKHDTQHNKHSLMVEYLCADSLLCWVSLMLIVTYADCHILAVYEECRYAECHLAESHGATRA